MDHAPVALVVECDGLDRERAARLLALELGQPVVDVAAVTTVRVRCDGATAELQLDDSLTAKTMKRAVDLSGQPASARERLVALAVAELALASWSELVVTPTPEVPPVRPIDRPPPPPAIVASAREAVARRSPHREMGVRAFVAAHAFSEAGALYGGGAAASRELVPHLIVHLQILAEAGSQARELGSVATAFYSAAPYLALHSSPPFRLSAGLGLRAGVGTLRGASTTANTGEVTGFVGGPLAVAGAGVTLARVLTLDITLEGMISAANVRGLVLGGTPVTLGGVYGGATFAAGICF